jgi:hypothetical protein
MLESGRLIVDGIVSDTFQRADTAQRAAIVSLYSALSFSAHSSSLLPSPPLHFHSLPSPPQYVLPCSLPSHPLLPYPPSLAGAWSEAEQC